MQNNLYGFLAKKFQFQPPGGTNFTTIAWMLNRCYLVVGDNNGVLRLILFNFDQEKSIGPPSASLLQDHSSNVSSDDAGLIIVWKIWKSPGADDYCFSEMFNNRYKSTVASLKWSNDGSRIAIAYEDGLIILGSVDGNRLWYKDIGASLIKLAWNTDDTLLLLGLTNGEVHVYDQNGNFCMKVQKLCVRNVKMETAPSRLGNLLGGLQRRWRRCTDGRGSAALLMPESSLSTEELECDVIVSMEWYVPTRPIIQKTNVCRDPLASEQKANWDNVPEGRPRFLIAYQHGNIQLMCSENVCKSARIVGFNYFLIICAQWSPDGSMFAVAGQQLDLPETERNVMHFISAYGDQLQIIRLAAGHFSGIAWEGSGYRIGALIDTSIYLVVMKRPYLWTYYGQTLVFAYKCAESLQQVLVFYETKMDVKVKRFVHNLCALRSFGDYCVAIFRTEELRGVAYTMQLCDSNGTPVDTYTTNVQPDFVAINGQMVLIASTDCFVVWHFSVPCQSMAAGGGDVRIKFPDRVHYVDEHRNKFQKQPNNGVKFDKVCAVSAARDFFLIARESGLVHRYSLPDIRLQCVHQTNIQIPKLMALNCVGSRLAVVGKLNTLRFFNLPDAYTFSPVAGFEREKVWMVEWDMVKDDTLAIMQDQRLLVIRGTTETLEPVPKSGRICQFKDFVVTTVLLDEVFRDPEKISSKQHFVNIKIKAGLDDLPDFELITLGDCK
uniref:WD repeat-containing protein 35 n=1 Tax=Globodera pallida TaxID=36090 RepID=A0A183BU49_GLOPA